MNLLPILPYVSFACIAIVLLMAMFLKRGSGIQSRIPPFSRKRKLGCIGLMIVLFSIGVIVVGWQFYYKTIQSNMSPPDTGLGQ